MCGRKRVGCILSVILDVYSRMVVGWSLQSRLHKRLVLDALRDAVHLRRPGPGLIFHSDRGSQYASNDVQRVLQRYKMRGSMSGKGNCYDNAISESFFGSFKKELVYHEMVCEPIGLQTENPAGVRVFGFLQIKNPYGVCMCGCTGFLQIKNPYGVLVSVGASGFYK
jgi:transposase InsO family protein